MLAQGNILVGGALPQAAVACRLTVLNGGRITNGAIIVERVADSVRRWQHHYTRN